MSVTLNGKEYSDQDVTCCDCGCTFMYTAGEQAFFSEKGFTPPKRCKPCRAANKQEKERQRAERSMARQPDQRRGSR